MPEIAPGLKRRDLGRYLMGLGIGMMIGVGQSVSGPKLWWWPVAVGILGAVIMLVGFELSVAGQSKETNENH